MRLSILAAATIAATLPAAPALAHCRTVHHRVHRVAWHAPRRHHVVRTAACGCRIRHHFYRQAVYETVYRRPPPEVEITYERPHYRPYPIVYAEPIYRPYPIFYGRRFHGFHGGYRFGFMHGRRFRGRHWR